MKMQKRSLRPLKISDIGSQGHVDMVMALQAQLAQIAALPEQLERVASANIEAENLPTPDGANRDPLVTARREGAAFAQRAVADQLRALAATDAATPPQKATE